MYDLSACGASESSDSDDWNSSDDFDEEEEEFLLVRSEKLKQERKWRHSVVIARVSSETNVSRASLPGLVDAKRSIKL